LLLLLPFSDMIIAALGQNVTAGRRGPEGRKFWKYHRHPSRSMVQVLLDMLSSAQQLVLLLLFLR
jgi:hypothetical protein